jgi:dipeptidyl aminopeptidase/acylaminoacyl peptidase
MIEAHHPWSPACASPPLPPDPCLVGAKEAFSCGIATAGIADWFCQQRHTEVRYYDYALMGGWVYEPDIAARATDRSPLTHVDKLAAPLLVLHGAADIDVPFAQVSAFVDSARAARGNKPGAPALEFVSFEGEGHGMGGWKPATRAAAFKQMADFLRVHLKPWDFTDNPHGDLTAY